MGKPMHSKKTEYFRNSEKILGRTAFIIMLMILGFSIWVARATLDRKVSAPGFVVPNSQVQVLQNLEGGIIRKINVKVGDLVTPNTELVKLDETKYLSSASEQEQRINFLKIRLARLKAEFEEKKSFDLDFTPTEYGETFRNEQRLFEQRIHSKRVKLQGINHQIELHKEEEDILGPLVKQGAASKMLLIDAQKKMADLKLKSTTSDAQYFQDLATEMSELHSELITLEQTIKSTNDQLTRTRIFSPVSGYVNQIFTDTIGGVVGPGRPILEIIPLEDIIIVEVRVQSKDIGYLDIGTLATLNFSAFDFTIFGGVRGEVESISPSTVPSSAESEPPSYVVRVKVSSKDISEWRNLGRDIHSGMEAESNFETLDVRVWRYLLKPIFKTKLALETG